MVNTDELRQLVDGHVEWLLVRESGRSFALEKHEIDIEASGEKTHLTFMDDKGLQTWRLNDFSCDGSEIEVALSGQFGKVSETVRLVPRAAAADLAAEVELARLLKANEIASMIIESHPGVKIVRVALNADNGRLAQITIESEEGVPIAALADVTGAVKIEGLFTHAILWLEKLGLQRKRPVNDAWIICEKRQARNAQRLHALLSERWKSKLSVFEIIRKRVPATLSPIRKRTIRELWRDKPPKLVLPTERFPTETSAVILASDPGNIDVVYARNGETLRFNGLPFARVRASMGTERAWFGIAKAQRALIPENFDDLMQLSTELRTYRTAETANRRHTHFRMAPEAWLESILRRNIKLLDSNIVLSPIYNQFRSSGDKIDLLALRRDGRLVIIELKTQPDREMIFQAVEYWRKIELQRRRGLLASANLFGGREILDQPPLVYLAAPAWSFHRDFQFFAGAISPEIEMWRFELHQSWRERIRVLARERYEGSTNR